MVRGMTGRIVLVRHGETEWSASGQHTGRTDLPLLARGEEQAKALIPELYRLLGGHDPVLTLTSPLQRARRTAELAGLSAIPEPDLREVDYGELEGLTTPAIRERGPGWAGWTVWTGALPGGETLAEVAARADRVLARAALALPAGDVVLVAHGHLLRILGARWLGLEPQAGGHFMLGTAALCVLGAEHGSPAIVHWNLVR
jgi:broad specificity phosphatase PhoE